MNTTQLDIRQLRKRILELSYKHGLSHIGSCISVLPILINIYDNKRDSEPLVLSSGHSALALYCVLEAVYGVDAESYIEQYGTHPDRNVEAYLYASTGSLGHGIGIALGMALANRERTVFVVISDGECAEGSVWEALQIKDRLEIDNLRVYANLNGYSALGRVDIQSLTDALCIFSQGLNVYHTNFMDIPFLNGIDAHYYKMTSEDWLWCSANL